MKLQKWFAYGVGILCAVCLLTGISILIWKAPAMITVAVVIICLSICSGILLPNPISLLCLLAGVGMFLVPPQVSGIVLVFLGCAGALTNAILCLKKHK